MSTETLKQQIDRLPTELQAEVEEYVDNLVKEYEREGRTRPTFQWTGALQDLGNRYTSVELQHKVSEWRTDD